MGYLGLLDASPTSRASPSIVADALQAVTVLHAWDPLQAVTLWLEDLARCGGVAASCSMPYPLRLPCTAALPAVPRPLPLFALPTLFTELFLQHCERPCSFCNTIPEEAALCLLCGSVVCCMNAKCAEGGIGACTRHAATCGAGTAAYLLLRACTVLIVLENERHCIWGSVYVDAHGEEDHYLRRGKSMFLNSKRYNDLQHLMIRGNFVHDSKVLASLIRHAGRIY